MKIVIFDIEGDSLTPTKIWCLAYYTDSKLRVVTSYEEMVEVVKEADILVGHNIIRFDIPVLERILKIKITAKLVDTLALSWYLYPDRPQHGLEGWGEDFGIPKPEIDNWQNLSIEEYMHRCSEDVKINTKLWNKQYRYLLRIYKDEEVLWKFIAYLSFKMDCAREQERSKWKLDIDRCSKAVKELEVKKAEVFNKLIEVMPKVPITIKKTRPAKPFKQDGSYSSHGANWFKLLKDNNLPKDYDGVVEVVTGYVDGNPNSSVQIKNWLYDCGWVPETFKYDRDKNTGEVRKIPQINKEHGEGICDSVKRLYDKHPEFKYLEGLGVISHRISILNGFLDSVDDNGYIQAQIAGLTNTLRFKHKTVVNLPKVNKPYGDVIRGVLIAQDGTILCGSDMSSLEDRLKQHYIYPYDPDYVNEMLADDYDPHLALALLAKEITEEQMAKYKSGEDKSIKPIRDIFKNGNYACQYGAGAPRLALTANIPLKKAEQVHKAYWDKNWAIKEVSKKQEVITVDKQMWLRNPINGFYYSLRYEKDIFSTLVQGSASYVFDLWVKEFRKERTQLTAQFHDEVVLCIKAGAEEKATHLLKSAIKRVNDRLKLNRELAIDVQFGKTYADIH